VSPTLKMTIKDSLIDCVPIMILTDSTMISALKDYSSTPTRASKNTFFIS
jgi:hypothetical protein